LVVITIVVLNFLTRHVRSPERRPFPIVPASLRIRRPFLKTKLLEVKTMKALLFLAITFASSFVAESTELPGLEGNGSNF
jgi:hypothetical protein